jgi:hypothetical protein
MRLVDTFGVFAEFLDDLFETLKDFLLIVALEIR